MTENPASNPTIDPDRAHRYFAADCFNRTWELIEKPGRTPDDVQEMLHRCHASRWHWGQFKGATRANFAVGDWQLARVYALAGRMDEARRYGEGYLAAAHAHNLGAFHVGYAHEALARIAGLSGDLTGRDAHIAKARDAASKITDAEELKLLDDDLGRLARGEHDLPAKTNA